MGVEFGRRQFISKRRLEAGQLISFGYNGQVRFGVVIAPEYKDNADCYAFSDLLEVPEQLLTYIDNTRYLSEGQLWEQFGDLDKRYRSFKRSRMLAVQSIEFVISDEEQNAEKEAGNDETANPVDNSGPSVENISE